jgi:MerR family transcriptional regulator, light-induced transcriptional regulator
VTRTAPTSDEPGPAVDPAPGLSVAEAARRVGVAGSTLRTWERRYGLRPSVRTSGGHRRYTLADVAALQRLRRLIESGMPTATAAARWRERVDEDGRTNGPRPRDSRRLAERFAAAVGNLDHAEAVAVAGRIIDTSNVTAAWTEVFVPFLQAAGERWECTGAGVEREHLAADAVRSALLRHAQRRPAPGSTTQILAVATEKEGHTLPLDALAAAVAGSGVSTCVLGTLPARAIHAAVEELAPSVVLVWARSRETADAKLLRGLVERVPVVCAAGPGWQRRRLPQGVPHLTDLPGAVASVLAWTT